MHFREAETGDIQQIQAVRNSVYENVLSDPRLVTDLDCEQFLNVKGKGWVCEVNTQIVGFAIADLKSHNIWALFVRPEFEKKGIGRQLHKMMLDWYFSQNQSTVWLGTAPYTRAEHFYNTSGWIETGVHGKGEVKFEMSYKNWLMLKQNQSNEINQTNL